MDKAAFVQKVKMLCLQKGIKPTNACKECGIGGSFLSDISRGQSPSVERVQLLANYLDVTTSELLGESPPGTPAPPEHLSPAALQMLKAYGRADSGTRAAVRKLLDLKNDDT